MYNFYFILVRPRSVLKGRGEMFPQNKIYVPGAKIQVGIHLRSMAWFSKVSLEECRLIRGVGRATMRFVGVAHPHSVTLQVIRLSGGLFCTEVVRYF